MHDSPRSLIGKRFLGLELIAHRMAHIARTQESRVLGETEP